MRGDFIGIWSETWREIWLPLISDEDVPADIFCELYRALEPALKGRLSIEKLADIIDDPQQSRDEFEKTSGTEIFDERRLIAYLEEAHEVLDDLGGDALSNRYFNLIAQFIEKYSLRYDLRRPCTFCPTLPGMFATLVSNLRTVTRQDAHLAVLMHDFEEAVRDLKHGCTDGRIKTCVGKQFMLIEALGATSPETNRTTLGEICDELTGWPHATVKESLKKLYGFASNYPGIRHGGSPQGVLRAVDMRDMVAMSILLAGFTPYLSNQIDADCVYWG